MAENMELDEPHIKLAELVDSNKGAVGDMTKYKTGLIEISK
jgi:hypothetical protein